ncbi:MAG TPA: alanine racemase [Flavobacteriaceae bacterium]|nr:alanine racemase [Flavobacteriaceae bacterium]
MKKDAQITQTTLEIDLSALAQNYGYIRSKIKPQTKLMAVVKANSYGSDSVAVSQKLQTLGVDYFAVAYAEEGILLRNNGIEKPILVLHPLAGNFEKIISHELEPNLYSLNLLKKFIVYTEENQLQQYPVHIKINTGMNRVGFHPDDIEELAERLNQTSAVRVVSVFSHLAASEDIAQRDFALKQIERYNQAANFLEKKLSHPFLKHTLNTSGILNFPEAQFDMVRSGIGLYGYGNHPEEDKNLRPIGTLKTVISQIHHIKKGENVGYNFGYTATRDTVTATLPLGHADGISRAYGKGKGIVFVNGQKAPTLGNICMDMFMIDITGIDCQEEDEVIIFGQGASAEEFAAGIGSISYEIITAISSRVKRLIKS